MENILKTIISRKLINKNETIGVGVSGGPDSMALLHYLANLQDELEFEVVAIHIDHDLRETSAQDAFFVLNYCKKNRIRSYKFKVDVNKIASESGQSIETAARDARYGVFESLIKKGIVDKIALAHHMEDQAETILLHLFRGSGLAGARGMDYKKRNMYIRPMLLTRKKEIQNYLLANDVPYVEDETNKEDVYQRNFIRNKVLPLISSRFPNVVDALNNFSASCQEDDDYISSQVVLDALMFENNNTVKIPTTYFLNPPSLSSRLVFKALEAIKVFKDIEKKHIEMIRNLAINGENGSKIKLPMDVVVHKEFDYITISNEERKVNNNSWAFKCGNIDIDGFGRLTIKKAKDLNPTEDTLIIDGKKLPKNSLWRFRKDGDFITKFGGGTQKLKTYLLQKKVPLRQRDNVPVLAFEDEVFVVAGVDISDKVKIDNSTTSAYEISVKRN
jgi:tRNA(Ile)-lysidine synthase